MPKFADDTDLSQYKVGNFGFTAVNPGELGASGYTLADIVADRSGSTDGYTAEATAAIKGAIEALKKHPRADNMLLRVTTFDNNLREVHGYKPLADIDSSIYDGCLTPGGSTALNDGVISAAEAAAHYGETLTKQDFDVNGIVIVITDGWNNAGKYSSSWFGGRYSPDEATFHKEQAIVAAALKMPQKSEALESYISILIGVNCKEALTELTQFHQAVGFTHPLIPLEDAKPNTIAKIGKFVSESVSSQSQALGSGGPSQSITF